MQYHSGFSFTWEGRKLVNAEIDGSNFSFAYNADGIRTQKTSYGSTTYYTVDGSKIISETNGNNIKYYEYDAGGMVKSMTYNGNTYYYVHNTMGDVVGITDVNGNLIVTYGYDPYGNLIEIVDHTVTGAGEQLGHSNPFRYRGYYYDWETGLYYLNSRYYDTEIGRFINADGVISGSGSSVHGYNMFAYCFNNPVNLSDSDGNWPKWMKKAANWVNKNVIQPVVGVVENIVQDVKNFDFSNESETKVLESNYFSCYKGVPVIRTNGERSASFGVIFLTRETNDRADSEDVVRHEYGHTRQLKQLGVLNYALFIGLPSWQDWGDGEYYSKPWEITADIYGGVQSRQHLQSDIDIGFGYLSTSKKVGDLLWSLIPL